MSENRKENAAMPTDLKLKNRIKILDKFRESSEITISEIMKSTGISRQTIVKSIDYFVSCGLILALGKGSSSDVGGKKPELYKFNEKFKYVICIRFQNNTLIVALMNLSSEIICVKQKTHRENEALDVIINDFSGLYEEVIGEARVTETDIYGAGICVSGICSLETGIMRYNSHYPSWGQDIEIVKKFKEILPEHCDVIALNEAKATAMAELYYDKGLEEKDIAVIYTYDGIAYAHIIKGEIVMGANSLVGEIGHICVDPFSEDICRCGSKGCFEMMVSEKGILRFIEERQDRLKNSALGLLTDLRLEDIFIYAEKNDAFAREIVSYIAKYFSVVLKSIILNTDPEIIIIQGIYSSAGEFFKGELDRNLADFKYLTHNVSEIIRYDNRNVYRLSLLGTSIAVIKRLFSDMDIYKNL